MTQWNDLTDAIPPAYVEFIGHQLIAALAEATAWSALSTATVPTARRLHT